MKIVCDNCATKYSIADEKVRGKVFKIRCKKCSHIIVVRGGEGAAATQDAAGGADGGFPSDEPAPAAPRGAAAAPLGTGEAVWHLVVDREQIGPLTREEVHGKFRAGEVDLETYAWREGFADWLRLGSIEDFRDLAGDAPAAAPQGEGATRRTDTADLFATAASAPDDAPASGGDLFGGHNSSNAPTGEAQMPPNEIFNQQGGGLFGAQSAAAAPAAAAAAPAQRPQRNSSPAFGGGGAAMAASAETEAPAASGSQKMTGQRNENSVLFSLNNLQALASGGGGGGGGLSKPAASAPEARPGFANSQSEGSGLIDIRAMAASTLSASPSGPTSSKGGEEPNFGSAPMFSPMAAPILMPAPASGPPKWIWALLGVGVLAVLGIVVVGVLLLTRKPEPQAVATVTPATAVPGPAVAPAAAPGAPVAAPAAVPGAPVAAPTAAKPDEAKPAADNHHKDHKGTKEPKGGHEPAAAAPVAAPAAPAAAAAKPKAKKGGNDELDDLLNSASPDKPAPKHSAPREEASGGDANLPDQLDKGAIVSGMQKIKGTVGNCYAQFKVPGLANVSVTIGKSGRVSSATVSGSFAGTPTGSCVEHAVKGASFPPVKGSPTTINYPFMLR